MSYTIGIDVGTSTACVVQFKNGSCETFLNDYGYGDKLTPSIVSFAGKHKRIGDAGGPEINPTQTVYGFNRLLGRHITDPEVKEDISHFPFVVVGSVLKPAIKVQYKGRTQLYSPERVYGMVLKHMKRIAEYALKREVTQAVVTVPGCFNDSQVRAVKIACLHAGVKAEIIIDAMAIALTYNLHKQGIFVGKQNVLIFDFGGGTLDISLIAIQTGKIEVIANAGNTNLGGEDFDNRLVQHCVKLFKRQTGEDVSGNPRAMRRLKLACERAKQKLSTSDKATIRLASLFNRHRFHTTITRTEFEYVCGDLFESIMVPLRKVLINADLRQFQVDEIVVVGGSSKMPKVQRILSDFFEGKQLNMELNTGEAVAHGAAVHGASVYDNSLSTTTTTATKRQPSPLGLGRLVRFKCL